MVDERFHQIPHTCRAAPFADIRNDVLLARIERRIIVGCIIHEEFQLRDAQLGILFDRQSVGENRNPVGARDVVNIRLKGQHGRAARRITAQQLHPAFCIKKNGRRARPQFFQNRAFENQKITVLRPAPTCLAQAGGQAASGIDSNTVDRICHRSVSGEVDMRKMRRSVGCAPQAGHFRRGCK